MRTKLESENHRLEDQVRHLRDAVDESKARISQLEKAQSYLEQERRDVSSAGQVQEALMKRLKTELEDALGIQRRLELERNSLREELSSRSRMDLHKHDTYGDSAERTSWDAEKKKLVEELEKRTGSLAQAERDSLAVAKQLKEATTKLHHLQTKFDDSDIPIPNLEEERNHRRDVEMRSDRVRRQLEEEIASLTSARKRLEERESFTEHQRRASDMKVHELQDIIESERGTKHKLREELHNIMITVRNLEGENSAIKRKLESQESPELSKAMRARMGGLEEENMALKSRLQMAESRLIGIEARAKASFDDKLRKVAVRLEEQSRERERIEKAREQNEQDMRERYERHIQKLVTELDAVRRVVDMHGSSVTGAVPVGVGARRSAWQQESHDLKDELFRQVEALKRSNQRLEAKFRGFEAISVNSMMDDIPRAAAAGRDGRSSPYSKKLRFAELLNEDDLCMKRVPNRISKSTRSPREAEDEEERPAAAPPSRRKRSTSRERREQVTSARTESAKAGTHRRPIITPTDQDDEDD
ncbi:hypothetical protein BC829DRAFT_394635 [Chytridium lagenaria]|nr:hypothetical protein BC829DRAFT_394635 [Chytridium lagenaria]